MYLHGVTTCICVYIRIKYIQLLMVSAKENKFMRIHISARARDFGRRGSLKVEGQDEKQSLVALTGTKDILIEYMYRDSASFCTIGTQRQIRMNWSRDGSFITFYILLQSFVKIVLLCIYYIRTFVHLFNISLCCTYMVCFP